MDTDSPDLNVIPHLVRDWELECSVSSSGASTVQKVPDPAGGLRRQRVSEVWQRQERVGRGGVGEVWLQQCTSGPSVGKVRAVKEIEASFRRDAPETRALCNELMAVIKFSHEQYRGHFVRSFGWYYAQGSIFIAMEYLPLRSLESHLENPLPEAEARVICQQALEGLAFMHRSDIAHRDMKPHNLLVQQKGPDWWIKITDFGCSKHNQSTVLRTRIGTPSYAAPELHPFLLDDWDGTGRHSVAVDIWAIGAISFRIVTGGTPFQFPPGPDLKRYVGGGPFPFPTQYSLSDEFKAWIESTMKPYPKDRPTAAEALAVSWIPAFPTVPDVTPEPDELPTPSVGGQASVEQQVEWSKPWDTVDNTLTVTSLFPTRMVKETDTTPQSPCARIFMSGTFDYQGHLIEHISFCHDGSWLASIHIDFTLGSPSHRIFFYKNDERGYLQCSQSMETKAYLQQVSFTPDAREVKINQSDWEHRRSEIKTLQIDGQGQFQPLQGRQQTWQSHPHNDHCMLLSEDAQRLIIAGLKRHQYSDECMVQMWGYQTGRYRLAQQFETPKEKFEVNKGGISPSGHMYLQAEKSGMIRCWKVGVDGRFHLIPGPRPNLPLFAFANRGWGLLHSAFSRDGRWLAIPPERDNYYASPDSQRSATIWEIKRGDEEMLELNEDLQLGDLWIFSMDFSPDSQRLALGWSDGRIEIRTLRGQNFRHEQWLEGHTDQVSILKFSPDGTRLASGSEDGTMIIWEVRL